MIEFDAVFTADMADVYRIAVALMRESGIPTPDPDDILRLAKFLAGDA